MREQDQLHSGSTEKGQLESKAAQSATVCECGHTIGAHIGGTNGRWCVAGPGYCPCARYVQITGGEP